MAPILFGFEPAVQTGQTSRTMFAVTADDLHSFGCYGAHVRVVDGLGQIYEPPFDSYVSFIPEPSTTFLLLAALLLLGPLTVRRA